MRVRAIAPRNIKRPRISAAYHASHETRHNGYAARVSNEIVSQGASTEYDVSANDAKPSISRMKQRLRYYLPFDDFSSSLYSVPMLLLFRLFYPAAPYSVKCALQEIKSGLSRGTIESVRQPESKLENKVPSSDFLHTYAKLEVDNFSAAMSACPELANSYRVSTLTWVKALASPLSHEFIQIVIEHDKTGQRHRLVTERTDVGDTVTVGWDWSSHEYASHHHILPLPLLSLTFVEGTGPSLSELGTILTDTSKVQSYNLLREMCWWYAEKVFKQIVKQYPHASVKQWPYASLRYSFVVQNEWIKRQTLVREAEKFRAMTRNQMVY